MLRITRLIESEGVTLRVDGELVEPWTGLLRTECDALLLETASVWLDLTGVTHIDRVGGRTLRELAQRGVRVGRCPGLVREMLDHDWNGAPHDRPADLRPGPARVDDR